MEFERKIGSAAVAGWWTLLIAALLLLVQWAVYLWVMSFRPAWMTWQFVLVIVATLCLWLTLWARQLGRARAREQAK